MTPASHLGPCDSALDRGRIPGGSRVLLVGSAGPCENWGAPPSAFPRDGFILHVCLQLTALREALESEAHTGRSALTVAEGPSRPVTSADAVCSWSLP